MFYDMSIWDHINQKQFASRQIFSKDPIPNSYEYPVPFALPLMMSLLQCDPLLFPTHLVNITV